jgi:hypothetical protein
VVGEHTLYLLSRQVIDDHPIGNNLIGQACVPVSSLQAGQFSLEVTSRSTDFSLALIVRISACAA